MKRAQDGSTLIELLAVLVPLSVVAAGALGFFSTHNRAHVQQDAAAALEDNLRAAMEMVTDTLRSTGCGVPTSNLSDWITWVSGFNNAPLIITDGGSGPDSVSAAACASQPVATITARANAGDTSLTLASNFAGMPVSELLNATDKSLIWIGDTQHARVTQVSGNVVQIDTDPTATGNQGLTRAYLSGTPITRIDVYSFAIADDPTTHTSTLRFDKHRGTVDAAAEWITDFQITPMVAGQQYAVTLTARAKDPVTGADMTRTLSSEVRLRN